MNYLDELANEIERELQPDLIPSGETASLFRLYALLALVKGAEVSAKDVHDAWSVWMTDREPGHPSLRPFSDLDAETRKADEPFVAAIRAVAAQRAHAAPAH